jgi:hypothetical protein
VSEFLSNDCESHLIQPGILAPPLVCATFAYREGGEIVKGYCSSLESSGVERVRETMDWYEHRLNEEKWIWTGANIAYDWGCVLAIRPDLMWLIWEAYKTARVFDVQIACTLNAIHDGRMSDGDLYRYDGSKIQSGRYSLDEVVKEVLNRGDAKKNDRFRLSYALLEDLPISAWPWDAQAYPVDDVVNPLECVERMVKKPYENLHALPVQCHAAFSIHLGAMWGLRTDPERVDLFEKEITAHVRELTQFAKDQGFMRPKSKKPGAEWSKHTAVIKEAVFKAYNGNPPTTPGGDVSMSREALMDSGDQILERFAEVGKWEKLQSYLPTLREASIAPLNPRCNPLLSTGRVSQDGLLLMIPRQPAKDKDKKVIPNTNVRQCFCARPGCVLCSCDYAAVELSTLAQVCIWTVGSSELGDAINAGKDPHCVLGADLLGIAYEEFYHRHKVLKEKEIGLIRQAGKGGNFGFPGMMQPPAFVVYQKKQGFSVCGWFFHDGKCGEKRESHEVQGSESMLCVRCVEQAAVIRDAYLKRWREVPRYWKWIMSELHTNSAITQFVCAITRGEPSGPAAANNQFQGLAAYGAKLAVIQMTEEMYLDKSSPLFGSRLPNFIHDETMCEHPLDNLHARAYRQAAVMKEQMKLVVPDVAINVEPAAMYFWDKDAEAVHDADGKLIPWTPKAA